VTAIATRARVDVAPRDVAPLLVAAAAFLILFANPLRLLAIDWWTDPDAGHGLLLAPLSLWLAWRRGLVTERRPQRLLGSIVLGGSVVLR
jgi:hypothetical protein